MERLVKVSVIVPTYNVSNYLKECMDSILNQTMKDIEVICIDDGSTDDSGNILDYYAGIDERVKVIHKVNGGYGIAMNVGIANCQGEYIGIVEPDDYIEKDMFEKLYEVASKHDLDCIKSNFMRFYGDSDSRTFESVPLATNTDIYEKVICPQENPEILKLTMNIWTGIYKRSFIEENNIRFNETPGASFQDNGFWIQTLTLAKQVFFFNDFFYMNRRDNPNSSVKQTNKAMCVIEEFRFIDDFFKKNSQVWNAFRYYYVFCKAVGYIAVFNRSDRKSQYEFIQVASEELNLHMKNGDIKKEYFGDDRWRRLNEIIVDPIQYFISENSNDAGIKHNNEVVVAQEKLSTLYSNIAVAQDRLVSIREQSLNERLEDEAREKNIKISIIIPVHNTGLFIEECIKSVINQSLKEIEIICINDGSTDDSFEKLLDMCSIDSRIRVFNQFASGSGAARNKGISLSKGEYIAFMDSDDWYPNEYVLEILYSTAKKHNVKICGGGIESWENGEKLPDLDYYSFKKEGLSKYSEYQKSYGYTRYIYDREMLVENGIKFPDYLRFQDPVFFAKAMSTASEFYMVMDTVYSYRKGHKRVKWSEIQCRDLLMALGDLLVICDEKALLELKKETIERIKDEYWQFFEEYLYRNSLLVTMAFNRIVCILGKDAIPILSKVFYGVSVSLYIPLNRCKTEDNLEYGKMKDEMKRKDEVINLNEMRISELEYSLYQTRISFTYKIGRVITFIPRKIRSALKGGN